MSSLLPERGPRRVLAVATAVNMTGYGVYLTPSVLYFTRAMGLAASRVGIGLTVAGAVALAAGVPVGHLADRRGARGSYAATLAVAAAAMIRALSHSGLLAVPGLRHGRSHRRSTGPAARGPLVKHFGGERPAEYPSLPAFMTNIGIALGAVLAGFGIPVGTRHAYLVLLAVSAACSAVAVGAVLLLPALPPEPATDGRRWIALQDRPYLALTLLDGVMAIQFRVLTAAIPLWLLTRTHAPRWSVSAVMLVNTAIVVVFQVRASRSIDTPKGPAAWPSAAPDSRSWPPAPCSQPCPAPPAGLWSLWSWSWSASSSTRSARSGSRRLGALLRPRPAARGGPV